jgi:glycerol kinase
MEASSGQILAELRADGGATANAWLMQFQADILGVPVVLAETSETTALGAAYLAGIGAGERTISDIAALRTERTRYEPRISTDERSRLLTGWHDAVECARNFRASAT